MGPIDGFCFLGLVFEGSVNVHADKMHFHQFYEVFDQPIIEQHVLLDRNLHRTFARECFGSQHLFKYFMQGLNIEGFRKYLLKGGEDLRQPIFTKSWVFSRVSAGVSVGVLRIRWNYSIMAPEINVSKILYFYKTPSSNHPQNPPRFISRFN